MGVILFVLYFFLPWSVRCFITRALNLDIKYIRLLLLGNVYFFIAVQVFYLNTWDTVFTFTEAPCVSQLIHGKSGESVALV